MLQIIDEVLNKITMYRVVLYSLSFLLVVAFLFSFFGVFPFSPLSFLISTIIILCICFATNALFSWAYNAPTNIESVYITAMILALIITPITTFDPLYIWFVIWVAIASQATKYLIAYNKKHIANPVAIACVIVGVAFNQGASWWVGTAYMAPFVLLTGLFIVRKIRRTDLVASFLLVSIIAFLISVLSKGGSFDIASFFTQALLISPVLFLGFYMLTEPLTTPPTRMMRIIYGAIVGVLALPGLHIASLYLTPELALVIGNVFAYIVSPKQKLLVTLQDKVLLANDTYEFSFLPDQKLSFLPGQYLEWTMRNDILHDKADARGNRRYFTIASSPTENTIKLGIKWYPEPSTFKKKLLDMKIGDTLSASQLAGEFVLPSDVTKKIVFIAGGIGVTPFRSMLKYCLDLGDERDIIMLYSNKTLKDIAYKDIFDEAERYLGIKTLYVITEKDQASKEKNMRFGFIDKALIEKEIPDYKERIFYISGPHGMVTMFQGVLSEMGIAKKNIETDFFPGLV